MGIWSEKRAGRGEDAEPLVEFDPGTGRGLIAALDGMGGAGGALARMDGDTPITHARAAAELGRSVLREQLAPRLLDRGLPEKGDPPLRGTAKEMLRTALAAESARVTPIDARLRGSVIAALPTTVALLAFEALKGKSVRVTSLWAGDARSYVLSPERGLSQMSRDDSGARDALHALISDPPTTNRVAANAEFHLNDRHGWFFQPVVLITATDGCFAYHRTPADLELIILQCLVGAADAAGFAADLGARLRSIARDDTSMSLIALGFAGFAHMQSAFAQRLAEVERQVRPLEDLAARHPDGAPLEVLAEARERAWADYRDGYEYYVPQPRRPGPDLPDGTAATPRHRPQKADRPATAPTAGAGEAADPAAP